MYGYIFSPNWHSKLRAIVERRMITPAQFCIILKLPKRHHQNRESNYGDTCRRIPNFLANLGNSGLLFQMGRFLQMANLSAKFEIIIILEMAMIIAWYPEISTHLNGQMEP
jgi:hypothetical protein